MTDELDKMFPSFEGEYHRIMLNNGCPSNTISIYVPRLIKHCKDNQRIREAISKIANKKPCPEDVLGELLKELGLD